jgi:DNA polymerase-1
MPNSTSPDHRLLAIDGTALAFRAFFAIRDLTDKQGRPSGAIYGFITSVLRAIKDHPSKHVVVVWDLPGPTFRHKLDDTYKANRDELDEDLALQFPWMREVTELMGLPQLSREGYEADDVIASLAAQGPDLGLQVRMFTSDKDLAQNVTDMALQCPPPRKADSETIIMGPAEVEEKFGLPPAMMAQYQAFVGDSSDNIKGMPGVGPKRATTLLKKYGSLEKVLSDGPANEKGKLAENLGAYGDQVRHALEMVTMITDLDLGDIKSLTRSDLDDEGLQAFCKDHSLNTIGDRFADMSNGDVADAAASDEVSKDYDDSRNYQTILSSDQLVALEAEMRAAKEFAFDTETTAIDPMLAKLVGMSFSCTAGSAYYVPCMGSQAPTGPNGETAVEFLAPLLADASVSKFGQNFKYDAHIMRRHDAPVNGFNFDSMIAHSLVDPLNRHNLDAMALQYFNITKIPTKDLLGTGKNALTMDLLPVDVVAEYACEDADVTLQLCLKLREQIKENGFNDLFNDIEIPLAQVLIEIEANGIKLDASRLSDLRLRLAKRQQQLETRIFEIAGQVFNLNSPKQLGPILFEVLEIQKERPRIRVGKTKTGYKTDAATLEKYTGIEIADLILEYRKTTKLMSTYVDALPTYIHPQTGCVHSSFNQALVATGRLSSSDPNMQNIPIRSAEGREIRKAFIPLHDDWVIMAADYSQVELRVVAHLSGDDSLITAFNNNVDIHAHTAASINGVDIADVDSDMRSRAKAVNFGILYGMGPHRLGQQTGMSFSEAQDFIDQYFEAFPKVREWLDATLDTARSTEKVSTLAGRVRPIPDVNSSDGRVRSGAENMAVNTPVQGSAADLIKMAMIKVSAALKQEEMQARMILQVHDELVFDCPANELEKLQDLVRREMEDVYAMLVPLKVDIGHGSDWSAAH